MTRLQASSARVIFLLAVGQYLGETGDAVVRQMAIDKVNLALDWTSRERQAIDGLVSLLFTTPAVPVIKAVSVSCPDSVSEGEPFSVRVIWENLGAGTSNGAFVRMAANSGFATLPRDSLALAMLAPGQTAQTSWTMVPIRKLAADSLASRLRYLSVSSGCANGLGDWSTQPIYVHRSTSTGVEDGTVSQPSGAPRLVIRPNPTATGAALQFYIPVTQRVRVEIFGPAGRLLAVPFDGNASSGVHSVAWTGLTRDGEPLGSGVYFVRMTSGRSVVNQKLVLLR
jgi:hypothetical protein